MIWHVLNEERFNVRSKRAMTATKWPAGVAPLERGVGHLALRRQQRHLPLARQQNQTPDLANREWRAVSAPGDAACAAQRLSKVAQLWFFASEQQKADQLAEVAGVQAPKWQRNLISDISDHASCAVEVRVLRRCHEGATPPNLAIDQCATTATQSGHHEPVTRLISA
jgi:hypothetical protein